MSLPSQIWADKDMQAVQHAARDGPKKIEPVTTAFANQIKALEDYLTERRVIQPGYSLEEMGIQDPHPTDPTFAESREFKSYSCMIDPQTVPKKDGSEECTVAKYISPLHIELAQYLLYLRRIYSHFELILARYRTCLDLERLRDKEGVDPCVRFDKEYRIVLKARVFVHIYLDKTPLLDLMGEMLSKVDTEAQKYQDDSVSATADLIRGLAICMTVSNKRIRDGLKAYTECMGEWTFHGMLLVNRWNGEDWNKFKCLEGYGRLVTYDEDQEYLRKEREAFSGPVGMDLIG